MNGCIRWSFEVDPGFGTDWLIGREAVPSQQTERKMTKKTRRKIDAAVKARIALDALREAGHGMSPS
jgi:hypothetical protein